MPAQLRLLQFAAALFSHGVLAGLLLLSTVEVAVRAVTLPGSAKLQESAVLAYAADGSIVTGFLSSDEKWRFAADAGSVDARYRDLLLAYEDRNFLSHRGVDPMALLRAAWQAVRTGRVVSGGSTLTMQLVRLLDPKPRNVSAKVVEALQAIKLERVLSKDEILDAYLTIAPFGGNVEGVRAASLIYLGKEPTKLSLEEAALLVAIPQAPEARRPDRRPEGARLARNRLLVALSRRGVLDSAAAEIASAHVLGVGAEGMPRLAPHLAARLKGAATAASGIRTLIDRKLQATVERIAREKLRAWEDGVNIAIMVMRNADGAVVAYVGAGDMLSPGRQGHVDLVRAVRSPGSTLKPFIYAMGFERLLVHPDTIVADQPIDLAGYQPQNADGIYSGDISIRQSLVMSKNTVPVMLLDRIGVEAFLARFRAVGAPMRLAASDSEAGLAVALGGVGVSLEQLVWFYSCFANEGELKRLRFSAGDPTDALGDLFAPEAANAVADILADVPPPVGNFRHQARDGTRRIGFKTGTSYGFRDAWTIGFDKLHTVGVWIGRPDGAPLLGVYGVKAAAPVAMQVFDSLPVPRSGAASGRKPLGALASPRNLPDRLKRFGAAPASQPFEPLRIQFPKNDTQIVAQRDEGESVSLPLRVSGGRPPYRWSVAGGDDTEEDATEHWTSIAARGQIVVTVTDADGKTDRSSFWLE